MNKQHGNEDQSRRSLSEIKKGPVKGLKNVLSSSQELTWPILKEEKKIKGLEKVLEELLPEKKKPIRTMSWFQLRKLSKEERTNLKKKNSDVETNQNHDNILKSITFGVNSVTKALEKDNAYCILLDSSVDPLFMIKHIVILAQNKQIPVVILPSLKTLTLKKVGFASSALAIKKSVIKSHISYFDKLYEIINELAAEFQKPTTTDEIFDDNSSESSSCSENSTMDIDVPCKKPVDLSSIYKYRTSCKERAFVPTNSKQHVSDDTSLVEREKVSDEFISLSLNNDMSNFDDTFKRITKKRRYVDNFTDEEVDKKIKEPKHEKEDICTDDGDDLINSKVENVKPKLKNINSKKKKLKKNQKIYLPLKVKQIKKNPNRVRATKLSKSKKNNK